MRDAEPVDYLRIAQRLDVSALEKMGGIAYLTEMADDIPVRSALGTFEYWMRLLKANAGQRALGEVAQKAYYAIPFQSLEESMQTLEVDVQAIRERYQEQDERICSAKQAVRATADFVQNFLGGQVGFVQTGFSKFDEMAPIAPGDLIFLGARPSIGKTALALNMLSNICDAGYTGMMFSMEMSRRKLMMRIVSAKAHIDYLRAMRLKDERLVCSPAVMNALHEITQWSLWIDDSGRISIVELIARARRQARKVGRLDFIVVDYIQEMKDPFESERSRQVVVEDAAKGLKALAMELDCPVLCLSQLTREFQKRAMGKGFDILPTISDLRDSGGIEQSADGIALLHRPWDNDGIPSPEGVLVVAKWRDGGQLGQISMQFDGPTQRFREGW